MASEPATTPPQDPAAPVPAAQSMWAPQPVLLVVVMALGAITMWAVSPIFWVWMASKIATRTTGSSQLTMPLALLILGGVVFTAIALGKLLGVVNRRHMRLTGLDRGKKHARSWNKSMRAERETSRERGLLEPIMFFSLGAAGLLMMAYFILFPQLILPG